MDFKGKIADNIPLLLLAKVLFNHENRIRALAGSAAVTPAQFRNALKNLI